ncbi:hypothetical protein ACFLQK_00180, partial [bacterium]
MIIIDDKAYVSNYPSKKTGDDIPVYVFEKNAGDGLLFDAFEKYFHSLFNRSRLDDGDVTTTS